MNELARLEYIHCAIQEALNGNKDMLFKALECVEDLREPYLKERQENHHLPLLNISLSYIPQVESNIHSFCH